MQVKDVNLLYNYLYQSFDFINNIMKEKTMFHQLTDLYIEALELEIQKKER